MYLQKIKMVIVSIHAYIYIYTCSAIYKYNQRISIYKVIYMYLLNLVV